MEKRMVRVLLGLLALLFCASQALAVPAAPSSLVMPPSPDVDGVYKIVWYPVSGCNYVLQESKDAGTNWATIYSGSNTYIYPPKRALGTYIYQVKAVNSTGSSAWKQGATSVTVGSTTAQTTAPTYLNVPSSSTTSATKITFGGAALGATYVLEQAVGTSPTFTAVYTGTNGYYYTVGLVDGTSYTYRVKAKLAGYADSNYYPNATGSTLAIALPQGAAPCLVCHETGSPSVAAGWKAGAHANPNHQPGPGVCDNCHNVANAAGATTAQITCEACHGTAPADHSTSGTYKIGSQLTVCNSCHEIYNADGSVTAADHQNTIADTHFDNAATATVVEGYVVRKGGATPCSDCHGHQAKSAIHTEWAASAHAGHLTAATPDTGRVWGHYNWDSSTGATAYGAPDPDRKACQRCHTATGVMNFLTNPTAYDPANNNFSHLAGWGSNPSDPLTKTSGQNELLYCWGCHSNVDNGALRNPGAITNTYAGSPTGSPSVTVTYPDASKSNVCVACHLGVESGAVIANSTGTFSNLSFINSHYLAAGGMVFNESGYEYAGQTYNDFGFHKQVGIANAYNTGSDGPCVTCHMTSSEAHSFDVVAKDTAGAVTAITSSECSKCHGGLTAAVLNTSETEFAAALDQLRLALLNKGIEFSPNYPYFYIAGTTTAFKNWDGVSVGGTTGHGKDVMGAAFNYNLIEHDPGAYAHNRKYALKLIQDSIDFLADGAVDGLGIPAAVSTVVASTTFGDATTWTATGHPGDTMACTICHSAATGTLSATHKVSNKVLVSNPVVAVSGADVVMTFNVKVDGVNKDNFTFTPAGYWFKASVDADGLTGTAPNTYPIKNDFTRVTVAPTSVVSNGNGNYTATWVAIANNTPTGVATLDPKAGNVTFMVSVYNATLAPRLEATAIGYLNGKSRDIAGNNGCFGCHGNNAFPYDVTLGSGHHGANPQGVEACVVCHTRGSSVSRGAGGDRTTAYVHGIHASEQTMAEGYDRTFPQPTPRIADFKVSYPTYMSNCEVCHSTPAQLAAVNSAPVSYSLCFSCHDDWKNFDHGNTVFGGEDHASFDWTEVCSSCHDGSYARATAADMHNGLMTERGGLIWDGKDVSVTEGAKINMQITGASRSSNNLLVTWTATYNGTPVDPCNTTVAVGAPIFANGGWVTGDAGNPGNTVLAATGQVNSNLSFLRAYRQGNDWVNAGVGSSPGQPASALNVYHSDNPYTVDNPATTGTVEGVETPNTTCSGNVATTTIALSAAERAATDAVVAIQGKAQVKLAAPYSGTKDVIVVRSKSPTYEFKVSNGAVQTTTRREIVDTAGCLKCHPGSLYQHGGNRIDNVDLCVMCHNEASSEQNVRVFDGVSASEAYDGKVGQTYGFKSLLHAVHSANENGAITMCYRTNGNYVWTGETTVIPHYPTADVYADGGLDDNPLLTAPVGSNVAALIYGSSAPHGTGPLTGDSGPNSSGTTVPYRQVYRAHNLFHPTYPQPLNNCVACHKAGTFGLPDPTKAVATTTDVGGVLPDQKASTSTTVYGNQVDDTLRGPAAATCIGCHQSSDATIQAALETHYKFGGFAPKVFTNGRADVINQVSGAVEKCGQCHAN